MDPQRVKRVGDVEIFDGVALTVVGDVILTLWHAPARLARMRWLGGHLDRLVLQQPGGVVVVQLILPSSSPPDRETRAEAEAIIRRHPKALRRLVSVPLGDTIWTQLVRSIMRGMMVILGRASLHVVVGTPRETVERVREVATGATPSATEISAAIGRLYAAMGVDEKVAGAVA